MKIINNIRAHILQHSTAAEKNGKIKLAHKIVSVKQARNEEKIRNSYSNKKQIQIN